MAEAPPTKIRLSDGRYVDIPIEPSSNCVNDVSTSSEKRHSKTVEIEKVTNVWGSSAGAGSDFFDIYRKHRYTEMNRLEKMEEDWKQDLANRAFQTRRQLAIDKNLKRKAQRRKAKKKKPIGPTLPLPTPAIQKPLKELVSSPNLQASECQKSSDNIVENVKQPSVYQEALKSSSDFGFLPTPAQMRDRSNLKIIEDIDI